MGSMMLAGMIQVGSSVVEFNKQMDILNGVNQFKYYCSLREKLVVYI
jgi:hypothetical protein